MGRKWVVRAVVAGSVALLLAGTAGAGDDDSPLAKIMKKADADLKVIRKGTASVPKFKKAAKDVAAAAAELETLGPEIRAFKEPAEAQKKPFAKWTEMADTYTGASKVMAESARKGDFYAAQKAWTPLNTSCNTCHGAFRPEATKDDF